MNGINSQTATIDYLQLLTVQLQNQDPIDPVDQEGLINDLAQFSQLEGIEGLNGSFEKMLQLQEATQGVNLVGKNVQYQDPISGEMRSGKASEMFTAGDTVNLLVDGTTVDISNITGVSSAT
ncbi:flagellar hook capping FlgD N-terminal domain-containing protein [Planctomycetes bacterium K23_9]|uniref:Basal-body rod modification protein FlgD n=1 Tax=Stieleria marina TaxID=1930275 RepID=A0A517NV11_9BACT|nr:Basal-body rod modification protein FlgD [Planctomycetes bacterium K23_9]